MALPAQALPAPGTRHARRIGRPLKLGVDRPACIKGHAGRVLLDGFVRSRTGQTERPRYRCIPADGGKPHPFRPPLRTNHPRHPASVECEVCERPYQRNDGPRVGDSFEFALRDIAYALLRVGQRASYRTVAAELRLRAKKIGVRQRRQGHRKGHRLQLIRHGISQQAATALNYVDAYADIVVGPDRPTKCPPILLLDAQPFRKRWVFGAKHRQKLPWPQSSKPRQHRRKPVRLRRQDRRTRDRVPCAGHGACPRPA